MTATGDPHAAVTLSEPLTESELDTLQEEHEGPSRDCWCTGRMDDSPCDIARLVAMARRGLDCADAACQRPYERHIHHADGSLYVQVDGPPIPDDQLPSIEDVAGRFDLTPTQEEAPNDHA